MLSRKFIITLLNGIGVHVLMLLDKIDPGTYSVVTIATVGAYITGNVLQKTKEAVAPTQQ